MTVRFKNRPLTFYRATDGVQSNLMLTDLVSDWIDTSQINRLAVLLSHTAPDAPIGTVRFQGSNDNAPLKVNAQDITATQPVPGAAATVSGAQVGGTGLTIPMNMVDTEYNYTRVVYKRTSGGATSVLSGTVMGADYNNAPS
jgi:hypothetical protein